MAAIPITSGPDKRNAIPLDMKVIVLVWFGAIAYTLGSDASWQLGMGRRRRVVSAHDVLRELMPFLVAGFAAPSAPAESRGAA